MPLLSPNSLNYYIGKGIVSFKKNGDSDFRDLGNVSVFELAPEITQLDHFSSRQGVKSKDDTVVTEKSAKVNLTADEWTFENVRLALLGGPEEVNTAGESTFEIFKSNSVKGVLKFVGTNDVGPRWQYVLNNVNFIPGKSINPISEGWGVLELVGDVLVDADGIFGLSTLLSDGTDTAEGASST